MLLKYAGGLPITAEDNGLLIKIGRSNKEENKQKMEHSLHRGVPYTKHLFWPQNQLTNAMIE